MQALYDKIVPDGDNDGLKKLGAIKVRVAKDVESGARPLTAAKFESSYFQHIDVRGRNGETQQETLSSILKHGFSGHYLNALPVTRYSWNADKKNWHTSVTGKDIAKEESLWLAESIYEAKSLASIHKLTAVDRYSVRLSEKIR